MLIAPINLIDLTVDTSLLSVSACICTAYMHGQQLTEPNYDILGINLNLIDCVTWCKYQSTLEISS